MNILSKLKNFRPAQDTVASIDEAIQRIDAAEAELAESIAAIQARRADLLLNGTAASVAAAEAELKALRDDQERLTLLREPLAGRKVEAQRRDTAKQLEVAYAASDAAYQAWQGFIERSVPMLLAFSAEGRALHAADQAAHASALTAAARAAVADGYHDFALRRPMLKESGREHPRTNMIMHLMTKVDAIDREMFGPGS